MKSHELTRRWDARWTREEQDEAVREADNQAAQARLDIQAAIANVEAATSGYCDALKWTVSIRSWRDHARSDASDETEPSDA